MPKELQERYPTIDPGWLCRVISSHMRDDEYVPIFGKNHRYNDSIRKLRNGEVKLIWWWRWYERIMVKRRPCQYFDFFDLWKSFCAAEFQAAWWTLTVAAATCVRVGNVVLLQPLLQPQLQPGNPLLNQHALWTLTVITSKSVSTGAVCN